MDDRDSPTRSADAAGLAELAEALREARSNRDAAIDLLQEGADQLDAALAEAQDLLDLHTHEDRPSPPPESHDSVGERIENVTNELLAAHPTLAEALLRLSNALGNVFR